MQPLYWCKSLYSCFEINYAPTGECHGNDAVLMRRVADHKLPTQRTETPRRNKESAAWYSTYQPFICAECSEFSWMDGLFGAVLIEVLARCGSSSVWNLLTWAHRLQTDWDPSYIFCKHMVSHLRAASSGFGVRWKNFSHRCNNDAASHLSSVSCGLSCCSSCRSLFRTCCSEFTNYKSLDVHFTKWTNCPGEWPENRCLHNSKQSLFLSWNYLVSVCTVFCYNHRL